ncbi:MAG: hypothetical protein UZ14_CFX002002691 [Chloroflexi bacterium OLB14]|nr:MAG: hypothetical protein UZ14_CFX002002691 [Chloroflexi bacterium OLB14]
MKAITVRQPWAWAIIYAGKDVENRTWKTNIRGRVAIHASQAMTRAEYEEGCKSIRKRKPKIKIPAYEDMSLGAIVGTVEIVDCVEDSDSDWYTGYVGFVLKRPKKLQKAIKCKGALSFWDVPKNIEARIKRTM